jgi:hypothetical protein
MVQVVPEETELGAVKTHDVGLAHVVGKLPHVATQVTGAFAVNVWSWPSATLGLLGVMARGTTETDAVPVAPELSVAVAVTVPDVPVVVAAAVKVLPLNEPRLVGLEYCTGIAEGEVVNCCVSPATTVAEAGFTSSDEIVMFADPVAPEPSVAVAVSVAVPVVAPAVKAHEVVLLQVGMLPSAEVGKDQLAETFEVKVNCVPSNICSCDGVTFTTVGGAEETVIVS